MEDERGKWRGRERSRYDTLRGIAGELGKVY